MDKFQNKYRIPSARLQSWNYGWDAAYFITICTKNREHLFGEIRIEKEEILFQKTMKLSPIGIIADVLWHEMKNHAKNVELDAFVVMPNHIHGIVILNGNNDNISINNIENGDGDRNGDGRVDNENGHDNDDNVNNGNNVNNNCKNNDDVNNGNDGNDNGDDNNDNNGNDDNGGTNVETRHALSLPSQPPSQPLQQPLPQTIGQQRFQNQGKNTISSIIGSYKSAVTKHANRLGLPYGWQSWFHDHIIRNNDEFNRIRNYIINNPDNWNKDKFNKEKEGANG